MNKGVPLKTRAEVNAFNGSKMLKVIGLDEFVSNGICDNRHCLLLPNYNPNQRELLSLDWGAVAIQCGGIPSNLTIPVISKLEHPEV